jgi:hypothetical protein
MTNNEQKNLVNYLNEELKKYVVYVDDTETGNTNIVPTWKCEDVLNVIKETIVDEDRRGCEKTVGLNYEAEYERKCEELCKMTEEAAYWKHVADEMKERNCVLETVLKTVEFILGRKFDVN